MKTSPEKAVNARGATLLEVVVALSVGLTLLTVLVQVVFLSSRAYSRLYQEALWMVDVQEAQRLLYRDLQPLSPGDVQQMEEGRLVFTGSGGEQVTYSFEDSALVRNDDVLVKFLKRWPLEYLDASGQSTTQPANLTFVRIHWEIENGGWRLELEEDLYVRN